MWNVEWNKYLKMLLFAFVLKTYDDYDIWKKPFQMNILKEKIPSKNVIKMVKWNAKTIHDVTIYMMTICDPILKNQLENTN